MIIEEGKAAKRTDQLLDHITKQRDQHAKEIARLEWVITYAQIQVAQLAQTLQDDDHADMLCDLAAVLHNQDTNVTTNIGGC